MKSRIANLAAAAMVGGALATGSTLAASADKNIIDTAVAAGQFKTLTAAINAAGADQNPGGPRSLHRVRATDAAFAKLPAGTVDNLLKPENKAQLVAILTYHVVPGEVTAADVVKLNEANTVSGKMIAVHTTGNSVMVNNAHVVNTDIAASNGVIHVIDSVLMPPSS
jgi:uncharacterized surface protein with fasciclin (FAS1) repeats